MSGLDPVVCSIGSTDPWNAAGLGLDIRAIAACGARPLTVVAGVTAQDRAGLSAVHAVPAGIVAAQLAALGEAKIGAYRIGALPDVATVEAIADYLARVSVPIVLDPVLGASGGGAFGDAATVEALCARLLPRASLVTPNLAEAARLANLPSVDDVDAMEVAARAIRGRGAAAVLVKGGHLVGAAVDVLVDREGTVVFEAPRLAGSLRGTGCLLGCAAAADLARGESLRAAVEYARAYVRARFGNARSVGGHDARVLKVACGSGIASTMPSWTSRRLRLALGRRIRRRDHSSGTQPRDDAGLLDRRWVDAFTPLVGRFVDEFAVGIIRAARNFARTPRCPIVDGFDAFTSLLGRLIDQSAVAISELHAASLGRGDARSPTDLDVFFRSRPELHGRFESPELPGRCRFSATRERTRDASGPISTDVNANADSNLPAAPLAAPARRRIMSGMRPTGRLHIGHYFGTLDSWVELARHDETFYMVADYHALTTAFERTGDIGPGIRDVVLDWLAAGIDPDRSVLYLQSSIPEIAEMHLLLSMVVPVAWLQRVPTFKDQIAALGGDIATYGFLGYPLMQLVDIAIVRANAVPVGKDQVSHLEFGREVVRRFNNLYGPVLIEPDASLSEFPDIPGTDGRKMSKSYGNAIDIADDDATTTKKVRSMVTDPLKVRRHDPGRPEICPVFKLHRIVSGEHVAGIEANCRTGELGCVDCKSLCAENLNARMKPVRERRAAIDPASVDRLLTDGAIRARDVTRSTLADVKSAMAI